MGFSGVWDAERAEVDYAWQKFFDGLCHAIISTAPLQQRLAGLVWSVSDLRRKHFRDDETWARFERFLMSATGRAAPPTKAIIKSATLTLKVEEAGQCLQQAVQIFSHVSEESDA